MTELTTAPVLSTPEVHIFEDPTPTATTRDLPKLSDGELYDVYEIARTAKEIQEGGWRKVALQFPDGMLGDAPRVFQALEIALSKTPVERNTLSKNQPSGLETDFNNLSTN